MGALLELSGVGAGTAGVDRSAWDFESADPDAVQHHLTASLGTHAMDLPDGVRGFRARQAITRVGGVAVHRLTYGAAPVDLQPEPSTDHIVVVQPIRGRIGASSGSVGIVAGAGVPVVLDAGRRYRTHWTRGTVASKVVIDAQVARTVAAELHGGSDEEFSLDFDLGSPVSMQATKMWSQVVSVLDCGDRPVASRCRRSPSSISPGLRWPRCSMHSRRRSGSSSDESPSTSPHSSSPGRSPTSKSTWPARSACVTSPNQQA